METMAKTFAPGFFLDWLQKIPESACQSNIANSGNKLPWKVFSTRLTSNLLPQNDFCGVLVTGSPP